MIALYYRVSTDKQSTDMQKQAIKDFLDKSEYGQVTVKARIYEDHAVSGSKGRAGRKGFNQLMTDCEAGKVSHVIVYKLDRLTRDSRTAIKTILKLDDLGVKFTSVTQPMLSEGMPFRQAIIAIFAELAQMEREAIVERVKSGMEAARRRGKRIGRPGVDKEIVKQAKDLRELGWPLRKIAEELGVSKSLVGKVVKSHV